MDERAPIPFVKMHGAGNDYLFLDASDRAVRDAVMDRRFRALVRAVCDRRLGVGADGVFVLGEDSGGAGREVRVVNSDGSEGSLCGNGVRCAAVLIAEGCGRAGRAEVRVRSIGARGVREVRALLLGEGRVRVSMGPAAFDPASVPIVPDRLRRVKGKWGMPAFRVGGFELAFVNVGNPHGVIFTTRDLSTFDLASHGPELERHPAFPDRMNIHVARVLDRGVVEVRNFERGAGETAACGSGACAVVAAGALAGGLADEAEVRMPGGSLAVHWDRSVNELWLTGPTARVCEGRLVPADFVLDG